MNPPPDPNDPSDVSADWIGFALNVGLKLAESFGLGLTLFNAMRARFPDVAGSILGSITSTIGQAVRAATGMTADEFNQQIGSMELPFVPASWHEGETSDRILAGVTVTGTGSTLERPVVRRVWVNGTEFNSAAELVAEAQRLFDEAINKTDKDEAERLEHEAADLMFLARRF